MSKGKDFRPRKRGFDDDEGPMSFESRSHRQPRAPFGGGFAAPEPGMPAAPVAKVVDTTTASFIFELTGVPDKINSFIALMRELGLVEVGRTGIVGMIRGGAAPEIAQIS